MRTRTLHIPTIHTHHASPSQPSSTKRKSPHHHTSHQRSPITSAHPSTSTPPPHPQIDLIITDVDGTLLDSKQELSPVVKKAVSTAATAGIPLVLATGKAIGPWAHTILPQLDTRMPQIFIQGLLIRDYEQGIIYQRCLEDEVLHTSINFAKRKGLTLIAYLGDRIICDRTDEHTDRLSFYNEPTPEQVGDLSQIVGKLSIYKLIFMAQEEKIHEIREDAHAVLSNTASLTTALPGMLEVLPLGASKGAGVEWLLQQRLGIHPSRCMAIGDGENDIEMLKLCGWGVAMGNAGVAVKRVASAVVGTNDEHGVAEAIEKYVLQPRGVTCFG